MSRPTSEVDAVKRTNLRDLLERDYQMEFNDKDMAICPFHDDHDPSFNVFEGKDGYWRWHCFGSGCKKQGDYFDFKALKEGRPLDDILKEASTVLADDRPRRTDPIAIYTYTDEQGNLLYRKRKFDSEHYFIDRYESGKWTPGLNGTRQVLYNLPELIKAPEVFLLEGEKDCETLQGLSFVATTMGSICQWKAEFAERFAGKDVVICFDVGNEKTAEKAGRDICPVAKSVKVLSLPGLTEREQDITDWFERMGEGTAEEKKKRLYEVVAGTPVFVVNSVEPEIRSSSRSLTVSELLKKDTKPRDIIVEILAEQECLTVLAGYHKSGKSLLSANLALAVAHGRDFLGFKVPKPRRVLYIQQEICEQAMVERLRKMTGLGDYPLLDNVLIANTAGDPLKLTSPKGFARFLSLLEENKPGLLIMDPLSTFHSSDENSSSEMASVLEKILRAKYDHKIGVVLVHHYGKPSVAERTGSQLLRGSSLIGDRADSIVMLDCLTGDLAKISFRLRNDADPGNVIVRLDPETLWFHKTSHPIGPDRKVTPEAILEAVEAHGGEIKQAEVVMALIGQGVGSRGTVLKAIAEAEASGLVLPVRLAQKGGPVLLRASGGQR